MRRRLRKEHRSAGANIELVDPGQARRLDVRDPTRKAQVGLVATWHYRKTTGVDGLLGECDDNRDHAYVERAAPKRVVLVAQVRNLSAVQVEAATTPTGDDQAGVVDVVVRPENVQTRINQRRSVRCRLPSCPPAQKRPDLQVVLVPWEDPLETRMVGNVPPRGLAVLNIELGDLIPDRHIVDLAIQIDDGCVCKSIWDYVVAAKIKQVSFEFFHCSAPFPRDCRPGHRRGRVRDVEPVKVAFVGLGASALRFHLPLLGPQSGTELAGVVARSEQSRARAESAVPHVPVAQSLGGLLELEPGIDLVVIATPVDSHKALATEALEARRHILVEKPFATNAKEARDLLVTASKHSRILTCFLNRRFDGDFLTAKSALARGDLGTPIRLVSTWERTSPVVVPATFSRSVPSSRQGGLLGTGSHLIDQALLLLGPATRVTAHRYGVDWDAGDNLSSVVLDHENGAISELHITSTAQRFRRRLELLGTGGQLDLECGSVDDLVFETGTASFSTAGDSRNVPVMRASWVDAYEQMVAAIRGVGSGPVSPVEIVRLQTTLDACFESAEHNRATSI